MTLRQLISLALKSEFESGYRRTSPVLCHQIPASILVSNQMVTPVKLLFCISPFNQWSSPKYRRLFISHTHNWTGNQIGNKYAKGLGLELFHVRVQISDNLSDFPIFVASGFRFIGSPCHIDYWKIRKKVIHVVYCRYMIHAKRIEKFREWKIIKWFIYLLLSPAIFIKKPQL